VQRHAGETEAEKTRREARLGGESEEDTVQRHVGEAEAEKTRRAARLDVHQ
jgi:hypothetical protein